jgi:hypothetical protein
MLLLLLLDAALLAMDQESGIHKRNVRACAFLIKVGPTRVKSTHAQSTVYSSFICKEIREVSYPGPTPMPQCRPRRMPRGQETLHHVATPTPETPGNLHLPINLKFLIPCHDSYENRRRDVSVDPSRGEIGERGVSSTVSLSRGR